MNLIDLVNIDGGKLQTKYISALEYQPKIFRNEIPSRKASAFLYIAEGEYKYTFLKGRFVIKSGSVVYLPKGANYKYEILSDSAKCMQFEFDCFYEDEDAIFSEYPIKAIGSVNSDVQDIFANIIRLSLSGEANESLKTNAYIMLVISYLADKLKGKSLSSSYKKILPAVEYIKANFTQKIYVKTLEKETNLSSSQIRRIFKSELNLSPIEYKNSLLTNSACNMLKGDNTVSEIADALGFDNVYAFSQFFKKQTGLSPTNYKLTATN